MVSVTHLILRFTIEQNKFQQTNKTKINHINDNHIQFEVSLHFGGDLAYCAAAARPTIRMETLLFALTQHSTRQWLKSHKIICRHPKFRQCQMFKMGRRTKFERALCV